MEIWTFFLPFVKFGLYLAAFLSAGGLMFELAFKSHMSEATLEHLRRLTIAAAWGGLVMTGLRVLVSAGNLGGDFASMQDPMMLELVMQGPLGLSTIVGGIGFSMITVIRKVKVRGEMPARAVALAVVLLSFSTIGHATKFGAITGVMLSIHLAGVAFWIGALVPLRRLAGMAATGDRSAGDELHIIADRFGQLAVHAVGGLVVAGLVYAAVLLGSVMALVTTVWGWVLIAKLGIVGGLLWLALQNRQRFVPGLTSGDRAAMAGRLHYSITMECFAIGGILLASSMLTTILTLPAGG